MENPRGDPRIYPWLLSARLLIALAFVLGGSLFAARAIRRPLERIAFLGWISLLADPAYTLPVILLVVLLSSKPEKERTATAIVHLLAIACGLTMWIKFTGFAMVGALAAAVAIQDAVKRRLPLISLEILASALAFWLLARQSLSTLPFYLRTALSMARSYGAEMFLGAGSGRDLYLVAGLLLAIAIPATVIFLCFRPWPLWPSFCWIALLFFLQLKEAFVRYDSYHVWMGIINGLVPCALILICAAGFFDPERFYPPDLRALTRVCAAMFVVVSTVLAINAAGSGAASERIHNLSQDMKDLKALAEGRSLSADYRQQLEEFRRHLPLRQVAGTADFFPDSQVIVLASGMRTRMPPIPQAFAAYNSYLTGLNAAFFRGAGRPDFVFFDVDPIDDRYPSSSDTLSWLAFMACYEPSGYSGKYLVLRAAGCDDTPLELISEERTGAGKTVSVPSGNGYPVWVQIDMRPNLAGSIVAAMARPHSTELAVATGLGRRTYRISPEAARTGFLLSPPIVDAAGFGRLFGKAGIDPETEVRDLTIIQTELGQRLSDPAISVRFYRVHLRRRVQHIR